MLLREEDDKLINLPEVKVQHKSSQIYLRPDMCKMVSETTLEEQVLYSPAAWLPQDFHPHRALKLEWV